MATLKAILRDAGIAADALYGTHLFPHTRSDHVLRGLYSTFFFAPFLYDEVTPQAAVEVALDSYLADSSMQGLRMAREEASFAALQLGSREALEREALTDVARAGMCVQRCVQLAAAEQYDIVGFSCTFEMQLMARALALNLVYFALSAAAFAFFLRRARMHGSLVQMGE